MKTTTRIKRATGNFIRQALDNPGATLDSMIMTVAPKWGIQRNNLRRLDQISQRQTDRVTQSNWDAASLNDSLRGNAWMTQRLSPDAALENDLATLRKRSQDLYENYGFCSGAIEGRTNNVVGTGIFAQSTIKPVDGFITATQAASWNVELQAIFDQLHPLIGRSGQESFRQVQRLVQRSWLRDGEAFVVFSDVARPNKPVPLQLDSVSAERVETPPDRVGDDSCRLGIQYRTTARREITGYWVRNHHPDDPRNPVEAHTFYPKARVVHVFERLYADQSRGVPWFASVLNEARDFKDFTEAVIVSAQAAACITLIIKTTNPNTAAAAAQKVPNGFQAQKPGQVLYTDHVDEVHSHNPAQPTTTHDAFQTSSFVRMASGLNYPATWISKDRRGMTFASGKLDEVEGGQVIASDQAELTESLLCPTWHGMTAEAVALGVCSIPAHKYNERPWLFCSASWIPPKRPYLRPLEEITAAIAAKEHNLATLASLIAGQGGRIEDVFAGREAERADEIARGIDPPVKTGKKDGSETGGQSEFDQSQSREIVSTMLGDLVKRCEQLRTELAV